MTDTTFIPNSYQTPNAYCDRLMYLLTPAEWKVLSYAVRRIFGFQKRQDRISLSQFVHGTVSLMDGEHLDHGTGLSKPTVIACLDTLMRYKLIEKLAGNDPLKNEGDLYALQLEYDQVDYVGLVERANFRATADVQRTVAGRNSADQKRLSLSFPLGEVVNGIDRGVVNGIDRGWSIGLTGGGQSDRPGVVNRIDTQYTVGNTEEIQVEGISLPDFDRACALLAQTHPDDLRQAHPVLLESDERPYRLHIKLDAMPPDFAATLQDALRQINPRRSYRLTFQTPAINIPRQAVPTQAPEPDDSLTQIIPGSHLTPEQAWQALLGEMQLEMTRATFDTWFKPIILLSANGAWRLGVPNSYARDWLQTRLYSTIRRILMGIAGQPIELEFVVLANSLE